MELCICAAETRGFSGNLAVGRDLCWLCSKHYGFPLRRALREVGGVNWKGGGRSAPLQRQPSNAPASSSAGWNVTARDSSLTEAREPRL